LSIVVVGTAWLVWLTLNILGRHWKRVVSILAAPFLAYIFCWMLAEIGIDAQRAHFEIRKPSCLHQIAGLPNEAPRFKMFYWGDLGFAAALTSYTVIYDESDEIALSSDKWSAEWLRRVGNLCPGTQMCTILQPEASHRLEIRQMAEHFYLVTEWYD